MSISYHEQFRENQRNKKQNGLFSNSKATAGGKLPAQRSTAVVKQPLRSDTFTLPTKRDETNFKVPKVNQTQNGSRRQATNKSAVINSLSSHEQKRLEPMRQNGGPRSIVKQSNQTIDKQNLQRKPVRFTNNYNNTYYSPSPPAYYSKTDSLPRDTVERSRRVHTANDDYIIRRRKESPAYTYNDYQTVSNIPTTSYVTSLPPISQSTNPTAATVVIHPKENHYSEPPTVIIHSKEHIHSAPPTVIPTISTFPSYPPPTPVMFLPSSAGPTYPPNSTMFLPNSTVPTYPSTSTMFLQNPTVPPYPSTSTMFLPTSTAKTQPPVQTFFLPSQQSPTYLHQPFFYPMPFSNLRPNYPLSAPLMAPPPPPAPPPPAPVPPTIINQSSSSSSSAPTTVKTENKTEENNSTIIVHPNTIHSNKKNVTIQLKMLDEENPSQRVVHVVRDPPYRNVDDVYYVDSQPQRVIYEQPRRRTTVMRRPPPITNDYVYVDDSPSTFGRRHPYRSEVVYVDNNRPLEYEEEVVYVDDHNNNIEYIYDDEPIYHHRRNYKKSRHPTSTNIVYE